MKPSKYREQMLKALLERYNDKGTGMEWDELLREATIPLDNAGGAWVARTQLKKERYVHEVLASGASGPTVNLELTDRGIEYAYWLTRSHHRKAWDYIKAHHLELIIIILAIVTIVVIVILA